MIKTSYFAQLKRIKDLGYLPISISLHEPKFFQGISFKTLAPTKEILKLKDNPQEYTKAFESYLSTLDVKRVVKELHFIGGDRTVCLLCYEKTGSFCHRHLVSKWLRENGYEAEEIIFDAFKNQNSLF